ncbi:MAG TPA: hypothetical protein VNK03_05335 [Gammaproteobacteria bacterium]|nr:hypothetical protein [Gammaproteobacteria bacterium]
MVENLTEAEVARLAAKDKEAADAGAGTIPNLDPTLKKRVVAVTTSVKSLNTSIPNPPNSTAKPLLTLPTTARNAPDTAACTTASVAVTDEMWRDIKAAAKENAEGKIITFSDDKGKPSKKSDIDIQRQEYGVKVSTTSNPPDCGLLVRNYKIAAGILKQETCLIESSSSPENTAKIILELTKEPFIKPVITDQRIRDALEASKDPECVEAFKKLNLESPKAKLR